VLDHRETPAHTPCEQFWHGTGNPTRSNVALLARCIELGLIRPDEVSDYRSAAANDD
jgi:hypothetical protein